MNCTFNDGGRRLAGYKGLAKDCVTRSIAIATGAPYKIVYGLIGTMIAMEIGSTRGSARTGVYVETWETILRTGGWTKVKMPCSLTIRQLYNLFSKGTFLVHVPRHLTCIVDGVIQDTWNCESKVVLAYWRRS